MKIQDLNLEANVSTSFSILIIVSTSKKKK